MRQQMRRLFGLVALAALMLMIFGSGTPAEARGRYNYVYTTTNAADGNAVIVLQRESNGTIHEAARVATGGLGTGAGLGSQGSLVLSDNGHLLITVNAGSDDISVLRVTDDGLKVVDRAPSGGTRPTSLALHDDLLYVLNAGSDTISGLKIDDDGQLTPLANSTRPLSGTGVNAAQVQFSPDGTLLAVTERATNQITTYTVTDNGLLSDPTAHPSAGPTPFGFAFDQRGHLVVVEAAGGAPNASSVSSYNIDDDGALSVISGAVPTNQTSACWIALTNNGRYAITTNTGGGTLSVYRIARNGMLTLVNEDGLAANTGAGSKPGDVAFNVSSRYMYVLTPGTGTIHSFKVRDNGSLEAVEVTTNIPASAAGMAAR